MTKGQQAKLTACCQPKIEPEGFASFLASIVAVGSSILEVGSKGFNHQEAQGEIILDKATYLQIHQKVSAHRTTVFTDFKGLYVLESKTLSPDNEKEPCYYMRILPQRAYSIFVTKE